MKFIKKNMTYIYGLLISVAFQIISINCFFLNTNLTTGGVSGLSLSSMYLLQFLHLKVPFGVIYFAFNLPLFIYAWFTVNKTFTIYSFINVMLVSFISVYVPIVHLTDDVFINAIFGSAFFAVAIVFALHYGHSTGGTDILGIAFAKKGFGSIGKVNIFVSIIAFTLILFAKDFKVLGYSLIAEVMLSIIVDKFYHNGQKETVIIISQNNTDLIKEKIGQVLERGCTLIDSKGGYSGEENKTILVVVSKDQLKMLHSIVQSIDKKAFINSWSTTSLKGEWTDRIGEHKYTLTDIKDITSQIETSLNQK